MSFARRRFVAWIMFAITWAAAAAAEALMSASSSARSFGSRWSSKARTAKRDRSRRVSLTALERARALAFSRTSSRASGE